MKKIISAIFVFILLFLTLTPNNVVKAATEFGVDLAYGRRVVASSTGESENQPSNAVDGKSDTRWASKAGDNEWFYVDLGSTDKINKVVINWEAAYAKEYKILVSLDALNWTTIAEVKNEGQTKDTITLDYYVEAKFVKFQGVKRGTGYGYSFYDFEVYGHKSLIQENNSEVLVVSSNENENVLNKNYMVDNDAKTRWASNVDAGDNQYFIIDLKQVTSFDLIKIRWEVSFARSFEIFGIDETTDQAPTRESNGWTSIVKSDVGLGEVDNFNLGKDYQTRYIKVELYQREVNEEVKRTGRYPWESTFSIYSFEVYNWDEIYAMPAGKVLEYSKNSPAWTAMNNITLNESGLILAPMGYPIDASGKINNLEDIKDGNVPGFESYATYNPAVIYDEEREMFHMIYRTELPDNFDNYFGNKFSMGHMSTLSYAYSYDGVNYIRGENNPIAWPTTGDSVGGGLEDPRVCKVENDPNRGGKTTYYITFTMYDNNITREGVIITHDFKTFTKEQRLAPDYDGAIKSGSYVCDPEGNAILINDPRPGKTGKVYMIYMKDGGYCKIGFTKDCMRIEKDDIVDVSHAGLSNLNIEALTSGNESCMALTNLYGPDDEDIYLMYGGGLRNRDWDLIENSIFNGHNGEKGWFYALGVLKTTKSNPFELTNCLIDLDEPTLYPTYTNKIDYGLFRTCMFADTMIRKGNTWYFYYGAGDMYVGLATARADFSASASDYSVEDDILRATTYALNKRFNGDYSYYEIEYVAVIKDEYGNIISIIKKEYNITHFSQLQDGVYSIGEKITLEINLSEINDLPSDYSVTTYVQDKNTKEIINNKSTYSVINSNVYSEVK